MGRPLITLAALALCAAVACGNAASRNSADSGQQTKVTDPVMELYTAELFPDGTALITFDLDKCYALAGEWHIPIRFGEGSNEFNVGSKELGSWKYTSLLASNMGNAINPVLCFLRSDGKMEMINVIDALQTGDVSPAGPLHGFDGVEKIYEKSDVSGTGVYALLPGGEEKMVEESSYCVGRYSVDDIVIRLYRDWRAMATSESAEYCFYGPYHFDPEHCVFTDSGYTFRVVADFYDAQTVFDVKIADSKPGEATLTFYTDNLLLETRRGIKFTRDFAVAE